MRRISKKATILFIAAGVMLVVAALMLQPWQGGYVTDTSAAENAGDYLTRSIYNNGIFVYEYDPVRDEPVGGYNILRHAGTTYALFELYNHTGTARYLETGEQALAYLVRQVEECGDGVSDMRCVIERNEVKIGGNGLALVALAEYTQATGDEQYVPLMQSLAEWLTFNQTSRGEFRRHKYNVETEEDSGFISSYYPGEAILGLVGLYEVDGDTKWLDAAVQGAHWLIAVRDAGKTVEDIDHDHWLLYGLNEIYEHRPDERYVDHARLIVDAIARVQVTEEVADNQDWIGGFYFPPRSTPTATRIEGLTAAHQLFSQAEDAAYKEKVKEILIPAVEFLRRTQFSHKEARVLPSGTHATGAFHESLTDFNVRIDYVQHGISALLGYNQVMR